ncbi:SoxR reducing system RseC family protein [Thiohalobacter thiocyanaticus]|uniref:Fis family transcriptional regulator n=1 Tax=Thiohalobacter thiocyanaticus TaxID=585455 RepID=A0A426QHG5_9GAMM|nr:SoxR reducing system RseC family protein [Thiohalobacter thiocyanaticus]RRQ21197.1 Fis family transcriptional regulator [Thiohalobacter thiocyanaticus]
MIEEQALVIEAADGTAWVETRRQSVCGQCAANKGCGTSVLARVMGNRRSRVRALDPIGVRPGQTVRIGLEEGAFLRGSMALYLLPLLTLFLGGLLGEVLAARLDIVQEWPALLGGLAGGGLGFLWLRGFARRILHDRRYQPVVLGIVTAGTEPAAPARPGARPTFG